jgi:hypothetical protein
MPIARKVYIEELYLAAHALGVPALQCDAFVRALNIPARHKLAEVALATRGAMLRELDGLSRFGEGPGTLLTREAKRELEAETVAAARAGSDYAIAGAARLLCAMHEIPLVREPFDSEDVIPEGATIRPEHVRVRAPGVLSICYACGQPAVAEVNLARAGEPQMAHACAAHRGGR